MGTFIGSVYERIVVTDFVTNAVYVETRYEASSAIMED